MRDRIRWKTHQIIHKKTVCAFMCPSSVQSARPSGILTCLLSRGTRGRGLWGPCGWVSGGGFLPHVVPLNRSQGEVCRPSTHPTLLTGLFSIHLGFVLSLLCPHLHACDPCLLAPTCIMRGQAGGYILYFIELDFFYSILGIEPRASPVLGKHYTSE